MPQPDASKKAAGIATCRFAAKNIGIANRNKNVGHLSGSRGSQPFAQAKRDLEIRVHGPGGRAVDRDQARVFGDQGVTRGLEILRNYDMGGYVVDFSPTKHNGSRFVDLSMIGATGELIY